MRRFWCRMPSYKRYTGDRKILADNYEMIIGAEVRRFAGARAADNR